MRRRPEWVWVADRRHLGLMARASDCEAVSALLNASETVDVFGAVPIPIRTHDNILELS